MTTGQCPGCGGTYDDETACGCAAEGGAGKWRLTDEEIDALTNREAELHEAGYIEGAVFSWMAVLKQAARELGGYGWSHAQILAVLGGVPRPLAPPDTPAPEGTGGA